MVRPWHYFKFHHKTGEGEPGYEQDKVPSYPVKIEGENLWINLAAASARTHLIRSLEIHTVHQGRLACCRYLNHGDGSEISSALNIRDVT